MIKIFNKDCLLGMEQDIAEGSVDVVITSPPYNNSRTCHSDYCMKTLNCRYAEYDDNMSNEEYCGWMCNLFLHFDKIVKKNGVVCFNISYGSENPTVMFECVSAICENTPWMIADVISWKKQSALPNNVSKNKLTRICEFVFVFCRKDEYDTFNCNKSVSSYSKTGQPFYTVLYNYIEAPNNDGPNELNHATFSVGLVLKLLDLYACNGEDTVVFDPFMGTGTTAVGAKISGMNCYGTEISKKQCEYAENRIKNTRSTLW